MSVKKRVLSVGFMPEAVPEAAQAIREGLAEAGQRLEAAGYYVDFCLLNGDVEDEALLRAALKDKSYDCICIGGGVRLRPQHTEVLEMVVNALRQDAPNAKICFNVGPADTFNAVERWINR